MISEREATILLNMVSGIGYARYRKLKEYFGSASAVFEQQERDLQQVGNINAKLAERIFKAPQECDYDGEMSCAARGGAQIFTLADEDYPEILRNLPDPPLVLYVKGYLPEFDERAIAVVGSRRMTRYGEKVTGEITSVLAENGFIIVSGLAFGVDTVAHRTTLECGGKTVAVLGGGLVKVHPQENIPLAKRIVDTGGAVISEFPMRFPVSRQSFPRRNRIVSGLCSGVVVTEAGVESGAMLTANLANDFGRTVFAVPGNVDNPQSRGCNELIRQGAVLVEKGEDILEHYNCLLGLFPHVGEAVEPYEGVPDLTRISEADQKILTFLEESGGMSVEELHQKSEIPTGELLSMLMRLEMNRKVERGAGALYRKL